MDAMGATPAIEATTQAIVTNPGRAAIGLARDASAELTGPTDRYDDLQPLRA